VTWIATWAATPSAIAALIGASDLDAANNNLRRIGCIALLLLIGCTFYLDIFHGMRLGQDQVAFHPIYRLRQSLAVAISRLHDPSPGGYLAYKSVVNVLNENGFALFDSEPGLRLDAAGWETLLTDGPQLNRIIRQAIDGPIDASLPPEIIQANELGYADYIYFSFRLFGDKVSSLYYFFYLIVAATCLIYILQFRKSPLLLFLLVIFLAELYFLEDYANSYGLQQQTVANSRLFSGLSLVPALHVLFVLWQRQPPRAFTVVGVCLQSLIFAFLLSCRTEVAWQIAMVAAAACGLGVVLLRPLRGQKPGHPISRLAPLWPAVVLLVVTAAYATIVFLKVDQRYATEPKGHIIWHEILLGIFNSSPELRREYAGADNANDQEVYLAVIRDLNARNDASSPIVRKLGNGELTIDLMAGWSEYEKLVRSLTLRIVLHHPAVLVETLPAKVKHQLFWYNNPVTHSMAWANIRTPAIIIAVGALICMAAGGLTIGLADLRSAAIIVAVLFLFASVTPWIDPGPLSIGSLFCYLGIIAIAIPWLAVLLIRRLIGLRSKPEGVSLGANSVQ
jgi:hypothetical protein